MNAYEKLIMITRSESKRAGDPKQINLGTMTSEDSCKVGGNELEADELMIIDSLDGELEKGDDVIVARISDGLYVILGKVVEI